MRTRYLLRITAFSYRDLESFVAEASGLPRPVRSDTSSDVPWPQMTLCVRAASFVRGADRAARRKSFLKVATADRAKRRVLRSTDAGRWRRPKAQPRGTTLRETAVARGPRTPHAGERRRRLSRDAEAEHNPAAHRTATQDGRGSQQIVRADQRDRRRTERDRKAGR